MKKRAGHDVPAAMDRAPDFGQGTQEGQRAMKGDGLPDRDTLLSWMSAALDGELDRAEEVALEAALDADPELLRAFEEMAELRNPTATAPLAVLSTLEQAALTRSVLAACAPEALGEGALDVAQLASLYLDGALPPAGEERLHALLEAAPQRATEVTAFAQVAEATGAALAALPAAPAVAEAVRPLAAHIEVALAREERAGLLYSALLDGELSADEEAELETAAGLEVHLALARTVEMTRAAFLAPAQHPDAARAGAAALQALEAERAQAEDARRSGRAATASAPSLSFGRLLARLVPAAGAAAAALAFAFFARPPAEGPPLERIASFLPPAVVESDPFQLLDDNASEVQALDSGSHLAAVFATEESQITVIWVAEPEAPGDAETGT